MNKVLVALSGGIDSATVVLMLRAQGYQLEALYIDMVGDVIARQKAVDLAHKLNVELHVEDSCSQFESQVVDFTLNEHQQGRTPSPCAGCNPRIKWAVLASVADRLGIDKIATGHYVRIENSGGIFYVCKGVDPTKDQSYYLWALGQDVLSRALTPLGGMSKSDVRQYLAGEGFTVLASGGESMGLCFMQGRSYRDFLRSNLSVSIGEVVDINENIVGSHDGYQLYTIGQKRGFESSIGGEIRRIDPLSNRLVVGAPLMSGEIWVEDFVLHGSCFDNLTLKVRGLGRNPKGFATLEITGKRLRISLKDDTAWAVCAGQPVVLYRGDRLVGGGVCVDQR